MRRRRSELVGGVAEWRSEGGNWRIEYVREDAVCTEERSRSRRRPPGLGYLKSLRRICWLRESAEEILELLADDERTAIGLAYYASRRRSEIADQLGLPVERSPDESHRE